MAAINTQFSIAIHIMAGLGSYPEGLCSSDLASTVNANPSFVRRILSKLAKAGLVTTVTGKGGTCLLAKSAKHISLLDIYEAVEAPRVFAIHEYPVQKKCEVSCRIKSSMERVLERTQKSMEDGLKKMSLADVVSDLKLG